MCTTNKNVCFCLQVWQGETCWVGVQFIPSQIGHWLVTDSWYYLTQAQGVEEDEQIQGHVDDEQVQGL